MAFTKKSEGVVVIQPANIVTATIRIEGTGPYVQHAFPQKARQIILADMAREAAAKKAKKARPPRDYEADLRGAMHVSTAGWHGIPASAFRNAMIDACRTVGIEMTRAKMSVFVLADGLDEVDETPLVRIVSPNPPERNERHVRLASGAVDIRIRPIWKEWAADVTVEFDQDMITADSVVNLLDRAGRQVGVGEGRHFSKKSPGVGWGTFRVSNTEEAA